MICTLDNIEYSAGWSCFLAIKIYSLLYMFESLIPYSEFLFLIPFDLGFYFFLEFTFHYFALIFVYIALIEPAGSNKNG